MMASSLAERPVPLMEARPLGPQKLEDSTVRPPSRPRDPRRARERMMKRTGAEQRKDQPI